MQHCTMRFPPTHRGDTISITTGSLDSGMDEDKENERPDLTDISMSKRLNLHSKSTNMPNAMTPSIARGSKPQPTGTIRVSRRNERERNRVRLINMGFERLRAVVPKQSGEQLSKISTLRKAIWYIEHLDRVLREHPSSTPPPSDTSSSGLRSTGNSSGSVMDNSEAPRQPARSSLCAQSLEPTSQSTRTLQTLPGAQPSSKSVEETPPRGKQLSHASTTSEGSRPETHGAVRMTSWSHPDTPRGPYRVLSGSRGRSVNQGAVPAITPPLTTTLGLSSPSQTESPLGTSQSSKQVLMPIFPAQWTLPGAEITSTPAARSLTQIQAMFDSPQSTGADSGYSSFNLPTNLSTRDMSKDRSLGVTFEDGAISKFPSQLYHGQTRWNDPRYTNVNHTQRLPAPGNLWFQIEER